MSEEKKNYSVYIDGKWKVVSISDMDLFRLETENKELRTRVAELTEKYSCCGGKTSCANNQLRFFCDEIFALYEKDKDEAKERLGMIIETLETDRDWAKCERKELHTSLSTLEQSILDLSHPNIKNILSELNQYKSKTVNVVAFHKLEDRLSTLLKASEGMEKALEHCRKSFDWTYFPEELEAIDSALADFRAVKEGK